MDSRRLRALIGSSPKGVEALHTFDDFRAEARRKLPRMVWDFVDGGAGGERSLVANRTALDEVLFEPHYLVDVAERELRTKVFGEPLRLPLVLSPSGLATVVHPDGEPAAARAAAEAGAIYTVSTASGYSMEQIAEASNGRLWFQLYLWKSEEVIRSLISRAATAGYEALVVTIDVPVVGKRERDLRNGMTLPIQLRRSGVANATFRLPWIWRMLNGPEITFANLADLAPGDGMRSIAEYANRELTDPARTWSDLALIRSRWDGPLLVKGVMSPGDALAAVQHGADGIIVSNHGGRQMSSVPGVAAVMPRIADAVGDRAEVFLDGGVQRGEDLVKARALGATAACGGRFWFWGLAAGGEAGVRRVLSILEEEADRTLALLGRRRYDEVDRTALFNPEDAV